jgi:hypothetical protein
MSLARRRMARQTAGLQEYGHTQMMTPCSIWSNLRPTAIANDTMPPRDPNDDDDEEEEDEEDDEDRDDEPPAVREPEPDE